MGSKGHGVGGSEGFRRSWKGDMGSKGPGRLIWALKVLEGSYELKGS